MANKKIISKQQFKIINSELSILFLSFQNLNPELEYYEKIKKMIIFFSRK